MNTFINDVRFAARLLARNPMLTLVAALSLGLGIGANTTIFSLINEVFLRPLPLKDPSSLVAVFTADERNRQQAFGGFMATSRLNYQDYLDKNEVFDGLVAHSFTGLSLSGGGEPEQVPAEIVSPGYFPVLGAPIAVGRAFLPDEERVIGAAPVTVLSHGLWQRRFGGDRALVGQTITVNGRAFTVVGVAAEGFKGTNAIGGGQLWVPFAMYRETVSGFTLENWDSRRALLFQITGRLKPGVTLDQASAQMNTIAAALAQEYPNENRGRSLTLVPLAEATINPGFRGNFVTAGALLMVIVGLVLLVACANVANLLLARASARRQEIAVRLSLGASRLRLIRQLLVESVALGLLGGLVGFIFALWARPGLLAMRPPFLPDDALSVSMDTGVLLFTAAVALGTGVLFGLVPALQFSRPNLAGDPNPLHGQGWLSPWAVERQDEADADLRFHHRPGEWHWAYEARQRIRLDSTGLAIRLGCRNLSDEPMPCGLGLHPYYPCTAETELDTIVADVWTVDEDILPVERRPADGRYDMKRRRICGQQLDNGYSGWSGMADIRTEGAPFSVRLSSPDAGYFQVYSPPQGGYFVAEPVTHANAALNEPEELWPSLGLKVLQPGEEFVLDARIDLVMADGRR